MITALRDCQKKKAGSKRVELGPTVGGEKGEQNRELGGGNEGRFVSTVSHWGGAIPEMKSKIPATRYLRRSKKSRRKNLPINQLSNQLKTGEKAKGPEPGKGETKGQQGVTGA